MNISEKKYRFNDPCLNWCKAMEADVKFMELGILPVWENGNELIVLIPFRDTSAAGRLQPILKKGIGNTGDALLVQYDLLAAILEPDAVSQSLFISACGDAGIDPRKIQEKLSVFGDAFQNLESLINYSTQWQHYIVERRLPLKRLRRFSDPDLRDAMESFLIQNPGINQLEKTAVLLSEICGAEKIPPAGVVEDYQAFLQNKPHHIRHLVDYLSTRRYPVITRYREELEKRIREADIPAWMDLAADRDFEKAGVELKIQLSSLEDVEKLESWLQDHPQELKNIIHIHREHDHEKE